MMTIPIPPGENTPTLPGPDPRDVPPPLGPLPGPDPTTDPPIAPLPVPPIPPDPPDTSRTSRVTGGDAPAAAGR